jgi:hypothetical protein
MSSQAATGESIPPETKKSALPRILNREEVAAEDVVVLTVKSLSPR